MNAIHYIVAGAQSPQGRTFIQSLAEQGIEAKRITALDLKPNSMSYGENETIPVLAASTYKQIPNRLSALLVLADPNGSFITIADDHLDDDARVLDMTGHFLNDPDAVIAPAEGQLVIQPSVAARMLKQLINGLPQPPQSLHVTALLPVSHFGRDAMDELFQQSRQFFVSDEIDASVFPKKLVFNVLPYAGALDDNGVSTEETRLYAEMKHLFPGIETITITALVVPVFIGLSLQVIASFPTPVTAREAGHSWRRDRAIRVIDLQSDLIAASPAEIAGDDMLSISRVHTPPGQPNTLSLWATADNTLF